MKCMIVWFKPQNSEYIEYIQMGITSLNYEYYGIMYNPQFPNKDKGNYLIHPIFLYILFMTSFCAWGKNLILK